MPRRDAPRSGENRRKIKWMEAVRPSMVRRRCAHTKCGAAADGAESYLEAF